LLGDHLVAVATATTDVAEYERLLALHKDVSAEMARIGKERMARWAGEPADAAAAAELARANEVLHRVGQRYYTNDVVYQKAFHHGRPALEQFTTPVRRVTLLDRGVAQAGRLVDWVRRPG